MKANFATLLLTATLLTCAALLPAQAAAQDDGVPRITLAEFKALLAGPAPPFVIDVRSGNGSKMPGAHHIPLGDIEARMSEIPRARLIVTYCA